MSSQPAELPKESSSRDDAPLQCTDEVWEAPGYWHSHRCTRRAVREVTGPNGPVVLCEQHAKGLERRMALWNQVTGTIRNQPTTRGLT